MASICDLGRLRLIPTATISYLFQVFITSLITQFDCSLLNSANKRPHSISSTAYTKRYLKSVRNLRPCIFGQIILIFNVRVDGARNIAISRWSWIRVWWGYNYGQTQKCTWMGSSFVISYVIFTHITPSLRTT